MESLPQVIVVRGSRPAESRTIVGNLEFDRKNILGQGVNSVVIRGTFNGEEVAVKRVPLINSVEKRLLENNQKLSRLNHPNIVQFKHYQDDDDFR